jgi:hypothetical protein
MTEYDPLTGELIPNGVGTKSNSSPAEPLTIPNLSDNDLRSIAREKLSEALQKINPATQPELTRKLCAELMDRLVGKPQQTVKQSVDMAATITRIECVIIDPVIEGNRS